MAEAGTSTPSNASAPPPAPPPTSSSYTQRSPRIHFPSAHGPPDNGVYSSIQSLGLGLPPTLHKVDYEGGSLFHRDDKRRRIKSMDASNGLDPPSRGREGHPSSSSKRTASFSRQAEQRERPMPNALTNDRFSDEFDLSREDPGVLEDVQRALRLKARREARFRTQSSPLREENHADITSLSSVGSSVGVSHHPFSRSSRVPGDSEIDFSPSIGVNTIHPIPTSLDGGATLDWSTPASDDGRERRWSLSRGKRKSKEQSSLPASKAVLKHQEAAYASKLGQIGARAALLTKRKAEMVGDQLERKYALLSAEDDFHMVNLLDVTRWYHRQNVQARAIMDKEEPSAWMKHLWDKHSPPRAGYSGWSPTALVMEKYVKLRSSNHSMDTIPENEAMSPISATFYDAQSPSASTYSNATPRHSLEAAISRKRASYDAQVSFEPLVESGRDSVGGDSRRNSDQSRTWKTVDPDSAHSSVNSISKGASPNSSHKRLRNRNLGKRLTRRHSDEALSSIHNLISENSGASDDGSRPRHQKIVTARPYSRPTSLQLQASPFPADPDEKSLANSFAIYTQGAPTTATQRDTLFPDTQLTPKPEASQEQTAMQPTFPRRTFRRSLPSSNDILARERAKHRRSADEQKEREEYEIKAQVLEETLSQNYRIRHLLQRVSASIRDYDSVQTGLSVLLGTSYTKIPAGVLDAFMHDPAAVTGETRRARNWRAVEDIHARIDSQSRTLQYFVNSQVLDGSITPPRRIFDDPVAKLTDALESLAAQRGELAHRAQEVETVLKQVKTVHATVKKDYNDTLAHTSLLYPELSQIAALEENTRDQYQQFWDIGLDALTLLLDTVTPVWRNYGKVIGEDVQDFLIIPWYRNEFTGEPKRYLIKQFPRRSLRHWVGLVFLGALSVSVTILQLRAAISLSSRINMPWISHIGLWWIILPLYSIMLIIQWCAMLIEMSIVVAQCGVVIWWMGWTINIFT